jgi:hypothetical protein
LQHAGHLIAPRTGNPLEDQVLIAFGDKVNLLPLFFTSSFGATQGNNNVFLSFSVKGELSSS